MVMNLKDVYKKSDVSVHPRKIELVVRLTNPRTKAMAEFNIPTTQEGYCQETVDKTVSTLLGVLKKWGYAPEA